MAVSTSLVPADQVIATATSVLEGSDTIDRAFFKEWIYLGLIELGPNLSWYGEATIYPADFSFKKPSDMHSAIDLALYDSQGKELRYVLRGKGGRIHVSDNEIVNDGAYSPGLGAPIDLSEDSFYYYIGTSAASQMVNAAILKYWKLPVDVYGNLLIPENNVMALVMFIRYMWMMRKAGSGNRFDLASAKVSWIASRNEARAQNKMPSMLEGMEIARTWPSMIQKMRFKQF